MSFEIVIEMWNIQKTENKKDDPRISDVPRESTISNVFILAVPTYLP